MPDERDSGGGASDALSRPRGRRDFLRIAALGGAGVVVPAIIAGCDSGFSSVGPGTSSGVGVTLDFSTDTGVLNYAYALEQLEAAFYTKVVATPYSGITAAETELLTAIRDHETIHRDFLAAALGNAKIGNLTVDFSKIDFTSRASVLGTAKVFEDLGVAAYNGAGQLLKDAGNLLVAGKIVSVEARHAAAIRDVLDNNSGTLFAGDDVVDANGLDRAFSPVTVLGPNGAGPYIATKINPPQNLPSLVGLSTP